MLVMPFYFIFFSNCILYIFLLFFIKIVFVFTKCVNMRNMKNLLLNFESKNK